METGKIQNQSTTPTGQPKSQRARMVARQFEAIFTSYLLKSMRKTIPQNTFIPKNIGERIYTDLLDQEYANVFANQGSLGLADLILKQIGENDTDNDALKALSHHSLNPWMIDNRFIPSSSVSMSGIERSMKWLPYISQASKLFNVDRNLITAVITQESAGNPYAVSSAGAKGLMQLMDSTAHQLGVTEVFNPKSNIFGGTRYLSSLLRRFNGDESLALASYNAGPGAVEKYNGIPPYRETQNYVRAVQRYKQKLAQREQTQDIEPEGEEHNE
jgi:hypothetical protein